MYINDKRLDPMAVYDLNDGDKVQFGVATSPSVPPEFVFQYYKALKVKQTRKHPADEPDSALPQVKRSKTKEAQVSSTRPANLIMVQFSPIITYPLDYTLP